MPSRFEYDRMTPGEFRRSLDDLNIQRDAFARLVGTDVTNVRRWANGKNRIPHWVAVMLAVFDGPEAIARARTETNWRIRYDVEKPGAEYPYRPTSFEDRRT